MDLVRVICCAMTVWAIAKACDVTAKFQIEAMIARKSCVEMWMNSTGCADVLGPS